MDNVQQQMFGQMMDKITKMMSQHKEELKAVEERHERRSQEQESRFRQTIEHLTAEMERRRIVDENERLTIPVPAPSYDAAFRPAVSTDPHMMTPRGLTREGSFTVQDHEQMGGPRVSTRLSQLPQTVQNAGSGGFVATTNNLVDLTQQPNVGTISPDLFG